jgi:hypothetical protein
VAADEAQWIRRPASITVLVRGAAVSGERVVTPTPKAAAETAPKSKDTRG